MPATIFQIEDGKLAFSVVDTADAGYADTWQAPNGSTLLRWRRSPTTTQTLRRGAVR